MRASCNKRKSRVAWRYFLAWSLTTAPPAASRLTIFRQRLGLARWPGIWQELVRQARGAGLVKDRWRLKDATHLIANVAIPARLQLVAQMRDQLLAAAEPFAAAEVAAHRATAEAVRAATRDQPQAVRLLRRVAPDTHAGGLGGRLARAPRPGGPARGGRSLRAPLPRRSTWRAKSGKIASPTPPTNCVP